jgi:hypothetical protein
MNCPLCQKALPEKYQASYCPYCGASVPPEESPEEPVLAPIKTNWWIFFAVLLASPTLTLLTSVSKDEYFPALIAIYGSMAGGAACGIILALRVGRTVAVRIILGIFFSVVFAGVCFFLSFIGCMVGLNLKRL